MRIHSDKLTTRDVYAAAATVPGVSVEIASQHGSRARRNGIEISLRGTSNRRPNFYNGDGQYAATWDEWGIVLGILFRLDPDAIAGSAKRPTYDGLTHYNLRTGWRFARDGAPADAHGDHTFRFAGVARQQRCTKCTATQSWDA